MSNYKPRIESNNLDLTSILSTINELPDAGPSVETCTINVDCSGLNYCTQYVAYTALENGVLTSKCVSGYTLNTSISDVVCGTPFVVSFNNGGLTSAQASYSGGVTRLSLDPNIQGYGTEYYMAPTTNGATGIICGYFDTSAFE